LRGAGGRRVLRGDPRGPGTGPQEEKKLRVLARVTAQELQWVVSRIRALCRARDVKVRELA